MRSAADTIILFDNGNLHTPPVSRAVEYAVDPVAKTATLVWQFRDTPDKYAYYMGNVQRLTNGNTHINWVLAAYPKACEVDSNGVKQLELNLTPGSDLYRSWRAPWDGVVPVPYLIVEPYPDNVTLIFNKFGDTNVDFYRIYGGTSPQPTTLLATTPSTLAHLSNLQNNQQYYFRVTAVAKDGTESGYSNEENVMVNLAPTRPEHGAEWRLLRRNQRLDLGDQQHRRGHVQCRDRGVPHSHYQRRHGPDRSAIAAVRPETDPGQPVRPGV